MTRHLQPVFSTDPKMPDMRPSFPRYNSCSSLVPWLVPVPNTLIEIFHWIKTTGATFSLYLKTFYHCRSFQQSFSSRHMSVLCHVVRSRSNRCSLCKTDSNWLTKNCSEIYLVPFNEIACFHCIICVKICSKWSLKHSSFNVFSAIAVNYVTLHKCLKTLNQWNLSFYNKKKWQPPAAREKFHDFDFFSMYFCSTEPFLAMQCVT